MAYGLAGSADHRARLQFSYDRAGNRIRMQTYVQVPTVADRDVETVLQADRWFTFDAMNRQPTPARLVGARWHGEAPGDRNDARAVAGRH